MGDVLAIRLLDSLYFATLIHNEIGATIIWNAMYHLECRSDPFRGRNPSFNRLWASHKDATICIDMKGN